MPDINLITIDPPEGSECLLYDIQTGMWINYSYYSGRYHDRYGEPMMDRAAWRYTHWMLSPKPEMSEDVHPDSLSIYDQVALVKASKGE